ncbi:HD-GYP domain-containing protein [Clostridium lundense]|uniref:HD-GYP domain-containing protein n=1 Tax=Clostridium lundense TaxID=319475 RepID=UPI0004881CC9|nr:HD domain-containing phosphohydrolase [Clostridium lundense]
MIKYILRPTEEELYHDIIESLVTALEAKDYYTRGHSERVANMTLALAKALGIKGLELKFIHIAAHLHDIGKIGVPDSILNKRGKLYDHEWQYIKMHPQIGFNILSKSNKLKQISKIVLHHHERWDGKGYPCKIKEKEIPLGSRIIAVCDSIDAMMSKRHYRTPLSFDECKNEILINKGIMYDPLIVDCFMESNINWMSFLENSPFLKRNVL